MSRRQGIVLLSFSHNPNSRLKVPHNHMHSTHARKNKEIFHAILTKQTLHRFPNTRRTHVELNNIGNEGNIAFEASNLGIWVRSYGSGSVCVTNTLNKATIPKQIQLVQKNKEIGRGGKIKGTCFWNFSI